MFGRSTIPAPLQLCGGMLLNLRTQNIGAPADETCCALLKPIGFTTTLPVVIVNTNAQNITRTAVNSTLCTCSQGLKKGDLNTTVGFRQRGGTNSRMSL